MNSFRSIVLAVLMTAVFSIFNFGCGHKPQKQDNVITIWAHQGQEGEVAAIKAIIDSFNTGQNELKAKLTIIPSGFKHSYEDKVNAASVANQLPDILDLDGPFVARYAWSNILRPIDHWISRADREDFLPSIIRQGTYQDSLYALGAFESSVVLYYNADLFEKNGIQVPATIKEAWDWETFEGTARKLTIAGKRVGVSLRMDYGPGEWYTYAFAPLLWSAGKSILSEDLSVALGHVNSEKSVEVLARFQKLFLDSVASANPTPEVFKSGKAAMEWCGHWVLGKYEAIKSFKVGVMPLPKVGTQVTPCGSWCWGMTRQCKNPDKAIRLLKWIVGSRTGILPMVRANGAPPARLSAYEMMPEYNKMPRKLFFEQLQNSARSRPVVPFYSVVTGEFSKAIHDIALGAEVAKSLNTAARAIDTEIQKGRYFE